MTDPDFTFETLNLDQHLGDLDALAQLCFAKDWMPGIFEWKYRANPQGVSHAVLAFHRGVLAGFYGVIPSKFRVADEELCVYQAVDAMVHPDFRRMRLFSLLGRKTYDLAKTKERSLLVYGITNYHILAGHLLRLGSHLLRRVTYRFTHRLMFWNRRRHEDITVEEVHTLSPEMDDYFRSRERSPCPAEKIWNRESLEWRVFMDPRQSLRLLLARKAGRLIGYCVFEHEDWKRAVVKRIDFLKGEYYRYSSDFVDDVFKRTDAWFVYGWDPVNPHLKKAWRGFLWNPIGVRFFSHRVPIITYSEGEVPRGVDWKDPNHLDIQPLAQD